MSKLKPSILITLLNLIPSKRHAQKRRKHLRSLLLVPKKIIFLSFFVFFTLAFVHFAFGQSCPGDVNQDGVVDIADFGLLSANYGNTCEDPDGSEYPEGTVHCIPGGAEVVEVLNPSTGRVWMDRNLGAERVAVTSDDELSYGDLYQWGRLSDGHQCRDSETTSSLSNSHQPEHADFITAPTPPNDWLSSQDDNLWQGTSGVNIPCPSGYRIPTTAEWSAEAGSWSDLNTAGAFDSPIKLTAAGGRSHVDGELYSSGSQGFYWSSSVSGTQAVFLGIQSNNTSLLLRVRAVGYPVRCIKDESVSSWDCPSLELNFGDLCNDQDPNTTNDVITTDCQCQGEPVSTPSYPEGTVHCIPGGAEVVEVLNPETGEIWMDRNLGASQVATSFDDELAYGDLYQWGRFSDGHQCRDSETTNILSSSSQPDHGDLILSIDPPWDWLNPQNENLWQGVNGINNPCPEDFRLPTEAELDEERSSWSSDNFDGAFNSPLRITAGGRRSSVDGSILDSGLKGNYWSSTVPNTFFSMRLRFNHENSVIDYIDRAVGLSIRCIKD